MKFLKLIVTSYLFLVVVSFAEASNFNRAERTIDLELKKLETKEIDKKLKKVREKSKIIEKKESTTDLQKNNKFYVEKITLINSEELSTKEKSNLIKKYVNKKIGLLEIHKLIKELTNLYITKGYIAARVVIPIDQNLSEKELKLEVFIGKIEEVELNWNEKKEKKKERYNLVFKSGDIVDLRRINYSENIMTRVPKSKGTFQLKPGNKIGETFIVGNFEEKKIGTLGVAYDNLGNKGTGENNIKVSYTHGNIFKLSDNLFIQGSTTIKKDSERFNRNFISDYSLPLGWWEIGGTYNYSKTKNTVKGNTRTILNESNSSNYKLKLNRTIYKGMSNEIKLVSNLGIKDSEVYIENNLVDSSSYKNAQYDIGMTYTDSFLKGSLFSKFNYIIGLDKLGADKDLENSGAKRQFGKFKFYTRFYKPFKIINEKFAYEFTMDSQYTQDTLYNTDKLYIGDETTVRGYNDGVSGEKGMFLRNQIYYTIDSKSSNLVIKNINGIRLFTGIDYGFVDNSSNKGSEKYLSREELTSISLGIKKYFSHGNIDLTYSIPLNEPSYIEKKEKGIFYITGSLSF